MRKHPRAPAPNPLRALCLSAPLREIFPLSNYHLPTTVKPVHYSLSFDQRPLHRVGARDPIGGMGVVEQRNIW